MKNIKEVTVFCNGDIDKISTWSGIPYFFCNSLKSKGIKINNIDITPEKSLTFIYNKLTRKIIHKVFKNTRYDYTNSFLRFSIIKKKIKKAYKSFPNSDCFIFFTFCYSGSGIVDVPSIMISDWTLDYYLKFKLNRKAGFFENKAIKRDDERIETTDIIFSLFPKTTEYLKNKYNNKNIFYIGNAVNSSFDPPFNYHELIANKQKSYVLLFIGGEKYLAGLITLLRAYKSLKKEFPFLNVHIIGINKNLLNKEDYDENVHFYGYLNKDIPEQSNSYYRLLQEATIYINTTPYWSSFQAPLEAMYFYTPLILSYNEEFFSFFDHDINECCLFCEENEPEILIRYIKKILTFEKYKKICESANKLARKYTWDNATDTFLSVFSNHSNTNLINQ